MFIKNRQISAEIKAVNSCQTLCLTESFVLRNRLLFRTTIVVQHQENSATFYHNIKKWQQLITLETV